MKVFQPFINVAGLFVIYSAAIVRKHAADWLLAIFTGFMLAWFAAQGV